MKAVKMVRSWAGLWAIFLLCLSGLLPSTVFALVTTTTVLSSASVRFQAGQGTQLSATVSASNSAGFVSFYDGNTFLGQYALNGTSTASTFMRFYTAGSHSITAQFLGDGQSAASTSAPTVITVDPATTTLVASSNGSLAVVGQQMQISISLTGSDTTGTLQIQVNGVNYGAPKPLTTSTVGDFRILNTYVVSTLPLGVDNVTLTYSGDSSNLPSTSGSLNIVVSSYPGASLMTMPRSGHTATMLGSGKVFVYGGVTGGFGTSTSHAELYDPLSNIWAATTPTVVARSDHTASLLSGGKVLVTGGSYADSQGNLVGYTSTELYNPSNSMWEAGGVMATARYKHVAVSLTSGKVLVIGGLQRFDSSPAYTASAELYDPATNKWTSAGSMTTKRDGFTATLLASGKVLVVGGTDPATLNTLTSSEIYDPDHNTWSLVASTALPHVSHTATLLANGWVAVVGGSYTGSSSVSEIEIYDPADNTWSSGGSMVFLRQRHTATLLANGLILICDGSSLAQNLTAIAMIAAELYDPVNKKSWSAGDQAVGRFYHTATLLPAGQLLLAGGEDNTQSPLANSELFTRTGLSTTVLTGSTSSVVDSSGNNFTITANIHGLSPTGTVQFFDPNYYYWLNNPIVAVQGGVATLNAFNYYGGVHQIYATYSGDLINTPSVSKIFTLTMTNIAVSAMSVFPGQGTTLTSTVSGTSPTGTVQFMDGTAPLGSPINIVNGIASYTASNLALGGHGITAIYSGDANNSSSTSFSLLVSAFPARTPTSISFSLPASLYSGQAFYANAIVAGNGSVSGTIALFINGIDTGQSFSVYNGSAYIYIIAAKVGDSVSLSYSGDNYNAPSTSAAIGENVNKITPSLSMSVSHLTAVIGQYVKALASSASTPQLTGALQFKVNGQNYGSPVTLNNDMASIATVLPVGAYNISASYPGDSVYLPILTNTTTLFVYSYPSASMMPNFVLKSAATRLGNGNVLVSGGTSVQPDGQLYTAANNTWAATGNLVTPRVAHTATLLSSGKVLVTGGQSFGGSFPISLSLSSAELFDPSTYSWSAVASMSIGRDSHTATLLKNGKVLVVGGVTPPVFLSSAELYDMATNTWTVTGSALDQRAYHTATLLNNGMVLIAGGFNGSMALSSAELYNPTNGTWSAAAPMPIAMAEHSATLLGNGNVLVVGGVGYGQFPEYFSRAQIYNPNTNTWTDAGVLGEARASHTATLLPSGKVLVAGGTNAHSALFSVEQYDPNLNSWTAVGMLGMSRAYHNATLLESGKVLISGGQDPSGNALANSELILLAASNITLTTSAASAVAGTSVVITAKVTGDAPTGTVQLLDNNALLGSPVPLVAGTARYISSTLGAGSHSIIADYAGDKNNGDSSSEALSLTITRAVAGISLIVSPSNPQVGKLITLRAAVSGAAPTGTVQFRANGINLGNAVSLVNGVASLAIGLPFGSDSITAIYSGDGNNIGTTSAATSVSVRGADVDTPTLPQWAAILMALALLGVIAQRQGSQRRGSGRRI